MVVARISKLFLATLCIFFLASPLFPLPALCAPATQEGAVITERRYFRGFVRRDMAERAARLAADLAAWDQAARALAKEPDLHFINPDSSLALPLDALARMTFSIRLEALGVEGFPPHQQTIVKVSLLPPQNLRASLVDALARLDLLELYAQALARQRSLLERYDQLAARLLPLNPATDGGQEEMHRLQSIINELIALDLYLELLPGYNHNWAAPEAAKPQLLRAERLAPNNPLILLALAEVFLQTDRPVIALEYVERALKQAPDFARGHDAKGAILLRKRLPTLAAESFGRAIALAPRNPVYHMHRGSAYLVLEQENAMCLDFKSACGLGDCEGLQWAKSVGRCAGF
jgi:tetratricopeptide (TPR) repeat protein